MASSLQQFAKSTHSTQPQKEIRRTPRQKKTIAYASRSIEICADYMNMEKSIYVIGNVEEKISALHNLINACIEMMLYILMIELNSPSGIDKELSYTAILKVIQDYNFILECNAECDYPFNEINTSLHKSFCTFTTTIIMLKFGRGADEIIQRLGGYGL